MSDQPFASGHCLCGAVSFSVANPPLFKAQCHCEHCQRATGTGHMSLAFFNEADVSIQGEETRFASLTDSGSTNTRSFCPTCGSRLFGRNTARPGVLAVAVGVFDDHSWYHPDRIVYSRSKPHWDFMDPEVPAFDTMPPAAPK